MMLREQLGRPAILKENLLKRSQDSLMDTIYDLKEELNPTPATVELAEAAEEEPVVEAEAQIEEGVSVQESAEVPEEVKEEPGIEAIGIPVQESLIDEEKDSSKKVEKISELDVKESEELSNNDYEATLLAMKFFDIEE